MSCRKILSHNHFSENCSDLISSYVHVYIHSGIKSSCAIDNNLVNLYILKQEGYSRNNESFKCFLINLKCQNFAEMSHLLCVIIWSNPFVWMSSLFDKKSLLQRSCYVFSQNLTLFYLFLLLS